MKQFEKWRSLYIASIILSICFVIYAVTRTEYWFTLIGVLLIILFSLAFIGLWRSLRIHGVKTEVDISRVLGKDAKDALSFGHIGILTYDNEYVVTWASPYFKENNIDIVNHKLTSWIENIRTIFDEDVDVVIGKYEDKIYEITRKSDAQILYVREITDYYNLRQDYLNNGIVVGLMQLDNYMEYQSYEDEELIAKINTHLRSPIISWAKENNMLIRRLRSDRFFVVCNQEILKKVRSQNFTILQVIKDEANQLDVSITLSMAFAYGTNDFKILDGMVNELIELAQSRGGDQVAIRASSGTVQFVGGNSETSSTRSKVRVRIMAQSIQEAINDSSKVFISGHIMSDFDCMGAALSMSNWVTGLNKTAYIVLKDVPRDSQLQDLMDKYQDVLHERHNFITISEAISMMDYEEDLLIMVDHGIPAISSAKDFVSHAQRIIVLDHHRRNESFVKHPMLTYVESTASSTCELIVELLQNIPNHIPIYEAEATIMYLGILVDTNRFKMHTDARTFEAAAALRSWGANAALAEKALCEDFSRFTLKHHLIQMASTYFGKYLVVCVNEPVDKTILAQVSESLLLVRGCVASFTIGKVINEPTTAAISARSDGTYNVQKIMEALDGGGHFSAAAVEKKSTEPEELKKELLQILEEEEHESNLA
ncbi:DHH family phosphoesterase [Faecalitalea cylindroides]|uniref:DHH family phosphoesterase n=1 Tax=Faecalitalea cylindroides TaxID=39483 RepID=UPI00242F24A6|nr:DHH family phosphoesterase [Faecalitalea cylindroides]